MSEESVTHDLGEMTRQAVESVATRDWGVAMSFYGPDSVWDMSSLGLGTYRGVAAIRGVFEDWLGAYEEFEMRVKEAVALNDELTLAVIDQDGQPVGSSARVEIRYAAITEWADGLIVRVTPYSDVDEGALSPSGSPRTEVGDFAGVFGRTLSGGRRGTGAASRPADAAR